ncbi:MAG: cytochrome c3 family protein [Geothermobacteraceae bacterium]
MKRPLLLLLLLALALPARAQTGIVATRHNLSASGPGDLTAAGEKRVCIFCHTPHHSSDVMPLWSRDLSSASYIPYDSSTLQAQPGQPTGPSRLCLSCHDGTIALGMLRGGYMIDPLGPIPAGRLSNLETDLSDDHPISFVYDSTLAASAEVKDPSDLAGTALKLRDGRLECTTCHDPHKDTYGKFLVMDNTGSALCETCHEPAGWTGSVHQGQAVACEACHQNHRAGMAERLLRGATEEATCLNDCHNGAGPGADIAAELARTSVHPVDMATGTHAPTENLLGALPHVECVDCHNAHRSGSGGGTAAPAIGASQAGVRGIDLLGIEVAPAVNAYEVCFRCHADNPHLALPAVPRVIAEVNERLRFDPANPSLHPVTALGVNPDVPSLRPEYSETSRIYCHDCHNSSAAPMVGGTGANGPHGSDNEHLLAAGYITGSYPVGYVEGNYALCFRCHDPGVLFSGTGGPFGNSHKSHVQMKGVPCSVCHDPHGVPLAGGATAAGNAHLINFDTRFVDPLTASYDAVTRSCTVSCHSMNPRSY